VIENSYTKSKGRMELEHAQVEWHLSIAAEHTAERRITIDGKSYAFTEGFSDLHTASYEQILQNNGFGITEVMPSVDMVERIRNAR
ncbi:MAG TPA: oxidoreductase, partial [Chitinophagales bacterium]|nr:oxidoreductase [Chitinophagales bacterium]